MKQKGFAPIIILVLVIAVLGVVGYFVSKDFKSTNQSFNQLTVAPSPTPTATVDPAANWKTYIDKDKEYSLKYPSQYFYQDSNDGNAVAFDLKPFKDCSSQNNIDCFSADDRIPIFSVIKYLGSQSQYSKEDSDPYHLPSESKTNLAGKNYDQILSTLKDTSPSNMPGLYYQSVATIFPHGNSIFIVSYIKERKDSPDYQQIYSQILSTFKFLGTASPTPVAQYTCPIGGHIDCMPMLDDHGLDAVQLKKCSPDAMTWYKVNCPDFKGAVY
jgi:hypothetical protein